jgi:hypothetical protein
MAITFVQRLALTGALALAATASSVAPAQAQSAYGYVFGAPGAISCCGESEGTFHVGGGGEFITPTGIGVGAEVGFLGPRDAFSDGLGVLSLDGAYHFGRATSKLRPFVTGGYSLFFREGTANLWNFGGGVQYWFREGLALRVEFRDHVQTEYEGTAHFWGVRVGVSFGRGRS